MSMNTKTRAGMIAAVAAGALAVAALAGTAVANAAGDTNPGTSNQGATNQSAPAGPQGQSLPQRPAEEALTGATADSVKAAVEAKYPGATIDRMEKDGDGKSVYEAHITKADGSHVTVMLDDSFAITGEQAFGGPGGPGHGPDGNRPAGNGPAAPMSNSATSNSATGA